MKDPSKRTRVEGVSLVESDWRLLRRIAAEQREARAQAEDDPDKAERIRCRSASVSWSIRWLIEQHQNMGNSTKAQP